MPENQEDALDVWKMASDILNLLLTRVPWIRALIPSEDQINPLKHSVSTWRIIIGITFIIRLGRTNLGDKKDSAGSAKQATGSNQH